MKKAISCTVFFHSLCFISMIIAHFLENAPIMNTAFMADMIGAVICPMILAVVGGVSGIRGEVSALKLYPNAAAATGVVGLVRGVIFAVASSGRGLSGMASGFGGAMMYLVFSFILLTIWFIIFEVTRYLMSRGTKYNKTPKNTRKKS